MNFYFIFDDNDPHFSAGEISTSISDGAFISSVLNNDFISFYKDEDCITFEEFYEQTHAFFEKANELINQKVDVISDLPINKFVSGNDITIDIKEQYQESIRQYKEDCNNIRNAIENFDHKKYIDFANKVLLADKSGLTTKEKLFIYKSLGRNQPNLISLNVKPKKIEIFCVPANKKDFERSVFWPFKCLSSNITPQEFFKQNRIELIVTDSFCFDNFEELFKYVLVNMIKNNKSLKKCANCNKYFYPEKRSDAIYCDNISPQNKNLTCKEYGSKKLWYEKSKRNESSKLYRNIYATKQMRVRRNPEILSYEKDFLKFKEQSKQWKSDIKKGIKTENEFIDWLNSVK